MRVEKRSLTVRTLLAAGGMGLMSLTGCDLIFVEEGEPVIESIDPASGPVGTEVTLTGSALSNPIAEPGVRIHFGGKTIDPFNEDSNLGIVLRWSTREIVFTVPLEDPNPGRRDVSVETPDGESNAVVFQITRPGERPIERFQDFVGAVILGESEEIAFLRLHKELDLSGVGTTATSAPVDPVLTLRDWDDENAFGSYDYAITGFTTVGHDVRINAYGEGAAGFSRLPDNPGVDGVHEVDLLEGNYTRLSTTVTAPLNPVRMASRGLATETDGEIAVLGEGAAEVQIFAGEGFADRSSFNLLAFGTDARPDAGLFTNSDNLLVAGHNAVGGNAWVANYDQDGGVLRRLSALDLDNARPVDLAVFQNGITTDVYLAYNDAASGPSGLVRYRQVAATDTTSPETATSTVSHLTFTPGQRLTSMLLDTSTNDATQGTEPGTTIPRLWLSVDVGDSLDQDDMVLGLRLDNDYFPLADTDYAGWKHAVTQEVRAAWAAATEVTDYAVSETDDTLPDTVTEAVAQAQAAIPVTPFTEIRTSAGTGEIEVADPLAMSLVPLGADEPGPTFLLVTNNATDSLLVVRTDVPVETGFVTDEIELPGAGPTRLYCLQSLESE